MSYEMVLHRASGKALSRCTVLPDVTTFSELFVRWAASKSELWRDRYIGAGGYWHPVVGYVQHEEMVLGPSCILARGGMLRVIYVEPTELTFESVKANTVVVGGDRMGYKIIDHDNGWSLVLAEHGKIIGSVWLAYIRTETIPIMGAPDGSAS